MKQKQQVFFILFYFIFSCIMNYDHKFWQSSTVQVFLETIVQTNIHKQHCKMTWLELQLLTWG